MPRLYIPFPEHLKKIKNILSEYPSDTTPGTTKFDEFMTFLAPLRETPQTRSAARLIRAMASQHGKVMEVMSGAGISITTDIEASTPITITDPEDKTKVRVYENLCVPIYSSEIAKDALAQAMWHSNLLALKPFHAKLRADQAHKGKAKKWESAARSMATIKSYKTLSWSQYLGKYWMEGKKSSQIRDMAASIADQFKPAEVVWCETPEDFKTMYDSGPNSCMSSQEGRRWAGLHTDGQFHPAMFYHYDPLHKGAFVKRLGKVAARCILRNTGTLEKEKWEVVRLYASDHTMQGKLVAALEEQGVIDRSTGSSSGNMRTPILERGISEFRIPAYLQEGEGNLERIYCPFPYFDRLDYLISVNYDKKTSEFIIKMGKGVKDSKGNSQSGFLKASACFSTTCSNCGSKIRSGNRVIIPYNSENTYCSDRCTKEAGFIQTYRSNGQNIFVPKDSDEHFVDPDYTDIIWYNKHNAHQAGALPFATTYEEAIEILKLSDQKDVKTLSTLMPSVSNRVTFMGDDKTLYGFSCPRSVHGVFDDVFRKAYCLAVSYRRVVLDSQYPPRVKTLLNKEVSQWGMGISNHSYLDSASKVQAIEYMLKHSAEQIEIAFHELRKKRDVKAATKMNTIKSSSNLSWGTLKVA